MNSFSVTSNIRTALKITGDITTGLQEFYNAPEEVSHVENEMTELTLVFDVIQRTTEAQKLDTNDDKTTERISSLVNNVENKLRNISTILHKVQSVGANGEQKISKKAWAREKSNVLKMVQELRKTRKTLFFITCSSMALVQMSSLPQRQWCVDIETSVTNLQASAKECYDVAREVTLSQSIESDPMTRCDTRNRRQGRSPSPIPILSIPTSKTITHCEYPCPCRCHIRSSFETPAWLKNVVGALFLNYTGSPVWGRQPCDHHLCMKSGKISSSYTYHFPYWMMAKAVVFSVSAHGVGGLGTAWTINIPNQLPGTNPVWRFLNSGTVQQLDSVLRSGVALPSDMNEDGKSLLHFAVENERPDMCDFLIQAGVNKSFQDNSGMTASMMALTKVIPATASESRTWKIHRIYEIFQDQDLFEDLGFSQLHRCIRRYPKDFETVIKYNFTHKDDRDTLGHTPLILATSQNFDSIAQMLLEFGANVSLVDKQKKSALHWAMIVQSYSVANLLLKHGADPEMKDIFGRTPLHEIAKVEGSQDMICLLLENGAEIDPKDESFERTPLHIAAYHGRAENLQVLASYGADIDSLMAMTRRTPLLSAIVYNHLSTVKVLLELGARMDAVDRDGRNILHLVARFGSLEIMQEIITAIGSRVCVGTALIDTNAVDNDGKTCIDQFCTHRKQYYHGETHDFQDEKECFLALVEKIESQSR